MNKTAWIDYRRKKPEIGQEVLFCYFSENEDHSFSTETMSETTEQDFGWIVAWMPIPEPPERLINATYKRRDKECEF